MPDRERWVEGLVIRCLNEGQLGYRARLDRLCAEHPEVAEELRARLAELERLGFLGAVEEPTTPPPDSEFSDDAP